jgi:hypothetical protein
MKSLAIIYHDADFDGKLSNEVCRYWLSKHHPEAAIHSYGWDYGRPLPLPYIDEARTTTMGWPCFDAIYIVDLSVDELMSRPELRDKIVWIDHHKSAIEKWDRRSEVAAGPGMFTGVRIDGVAACRLCWQWLAFENGPHGDPRLHPSDIYTPSKQDYIDRKVNEPQLIRLAGEYDIWDHRDPNAKILQFGLRACSSRELRELVAWQFDGRPEGCGLLENVIGGGRLIKSYMDKQNEEYAAQMAGDVIWEGLIFLAINSSHRNSDAFLGAIKDHHDALLNWRFDPKSKLATVSLYHAPGKEHHDLSLIAAKYGGGGHKGACGFRVNLSTLEQILTE